MQALLTTTADAVAKKTGSIQRQRTVTGSGFAQTLVLGYLANPHAAREELHQTAAGAGMALSSQGLDKRFTPKAVYFLDSLLVEAVTQVASVIPRSPAHRGERP